MGLAALVSGLTWSQSGLAEDSSLEPKPPPISAQYVQYGVSLAAETVPSAGDVCPAGASAPCILGAGAGLGVRVGWRTRSVWYWGGAYEFARSDASNLLKLAILQQFRAESRYYFSRAFRVNPYASAAIGGLLYGNEWTVDTWGLLGSVGGGFEVQVSNTTLVGAALSYRPALVHRWTDGAGQQRADRALGFGLAHLIAFELNLELQNPLSRW